MGGVPDSGKASSVGSSLRKSCPQRQLQCFEQREQNGFLPQRKQVASSCPAPRLERSNELKNNQVGAHSFGTALSSRKTERSLALASRGMIGLEQPDRSPVLKAQGESPARKQRPGIRADLAPRRGEKGTLHLTFILLS